ncbi:MAG: hypothetical protein KJ077_50535 [Anaerolineae bacterium]|nr:hypothetical protein [Anaerolineae bacterium]
MAKVIGPLFSMKVSGALGEIIFDRRGYVRRKGRVRDPKTSRQGDFRQAMMAAQEGVKVCGPQTRQHLRRLSDEPARWSAFLLKHLLGPRRANYDGCLARYGELGLDRAGWEAAAVEAGLRPVGLTYAADTEITPGAQLFLLASTLFSLGIYGELGQPGGNAKVWQESIIS